jgi:hypothetical protein
MWDSSSDIVDSLIFQKSLQIGINTTAPAATLDVNGKGDLRDTLTLFPKGTDPTLAVNGTTFKVDQTGKVTFISSQKFPGTGSITGVTAGTDLVGGGTSGKVTLYLDTTKVPQLNASNDFSGNQFVTGNFSVTGVARIANPTSGLGLDVYSSTRGTHAPMAQFGSLGTNDSNSILTYNGTGSTEMFQAGCVSCFIPGTQPGDGGLRVASGKNILLGDQNASRVTLDSAGNASQPRAAGGMVKAMVYFSGFNNGGIAYCFNSALAGTDATTPPCGFASTKFGTADYLIDFGFEVDDRFFSVTHSYDLGGPEPVVCTATNGTAFICSQPGRPQRKPGGGLFWWFLR